MTDLLPPSSPVAASHEVVGSKPAPQSFVGLLAKSTDGELYPTPNPSSSIGKLSSPVSRRANAASSPVRVETSPPVIETPQQDKTLVSIELDPNDTRKLVIGRKSNLCDIILPSKKYISRQHALISYNPQRNQIKLECLGTNGIIVVLPRKLSCQLIQKNPEKKIYELSTALFAQNVAKEIVKAHKLTSFVLLKSECVIMPFMRDTKLDFRQCEAEISLKQVDVYQEENTDDELPAEVASATPNVPNENITPNVSFQIKTPATPIKPIKTSLTESLDQGTPTSKQIPTVHKLDTPSPQKKDSTHKHKNTKSTKMQNETAMHNIESKEDILAKIKSTKDIKCDELQRVLANHLAFSNVQQTPLYQLQNVNSKTRSLSRQELRALLATEPCIGIIYRQGKDAAGKPLDEEYYYDLENDPDHERRSLVSSLKGGRTGLRSCRRTHKQYFWKKPAK